MAITAERLQIQVEANGADAAAAELAAIRSSAIDAKKGVAILGGALAAASAGGIYKATRAAIDFQSQLAEVQKVTSADFVKTANDQILEMARRIPLSTSELSSLYEQAGRFGVAEKNIQGFVESVAKMATATDLTADEAGEAFAKLSTLTKTPIPQVENLGSAINSLSNTAATSSSEIVDNMLRSAGSLSQIGASNTEIAGLAAALNEVSPNASRAGSQLARLAQEMVDPRKTMDLARAMGMNANEFKRAVKNDPTGMIRRMAQTMRDGGKNADILARTLSVTSKKALTGLGQNLSGLDSALATANESFRDGTSLQREFQIASQTAKNQLSLLKNELAVAAITTGQNFLPALAAVLGVAKMAVSWFNDLNSATGGMAGTIVLVTGLVGGLVAAIGALATSTAAAGAIGALGTAIATILGPIGLVIAAVGALAVAFQTDFAGIRTATMNVLNVFRNQFGPVIQTAVRIVGGIISDLASVFKTNGSSIRGQIQLIVGAIANTLIAAIRSGAQVARQLLASLSLWWVKHGQQVKTAIRAGYVAAKTLIAGVVTTLRTIVGTALAAIQGFWRAHGTQIMAIVRQVVAVLRQIYLAVFPVLKSTVLGALSTIRSLWQTHGAAVMAQVRTLITAVVGLFRQIASIVLPIVRTALSSILTFWRNHGRQVTTFLRGAFNAVTAIVGTALDVVVTAIRVGLNTATGIIRIFTAVLRGDFGKAWQIAKQTVSKNLGLIKGLVTRIFNGIVNFVKTWGGRLVSSFVGIVKGVVQVFLDLGKKLIWGSIVPDMLGAIVDAVSSFVGDVVGRIKGFASDVVRGFTDLKNRAVTQATQLKDQTIARAQQLADQAGRKVTQLKDRALRTFEQLKSQGVTKVTQLKDQTIGKAEQMASQAVGKAERMKSQMLGKFDQLKRTATTKAGQLVNQVAGKLSDLASKAKNAGKGMVKALAKGIKSAASKAKGAAEKVVRDVRKLLPGSDADTGPLSDLTKSGAALPITLARGMLANAGRLSDAARRIAEAMRPALADALETALTSAFKQAMQAVRMTPAVAARATGTGSGATGGPYGGFGADYLNNLFRSGEIGAGIDFGGIRKALVGGRVANKFWDRALAMANDERGRGAALEYIRDKRGTAPRSERPGGGGDIIFRKGAIQIDGSDSPEKTADAVVDGVIARIPR